MSRRAIILGGVGLALISFAIVLLSVDVAENAADSRGAIAKTQTTRDETLRLTVPEMRRVRNTPVYTAAAADEDKLDAGAIRVEGTGLPWEEEANVYIAGHRLGYPNTGSFLLFYDLDELRRGDIMALRDAEGRRYVYRVFRKLTVGPKQLKVTEPLAGRNIISLQACTLPTYTKRLVVQAELMRIREQVRHRPARAGEGQVPPDQGPPNQGLRPVDPERGPVAGGAPGVAGPQGSGSQGQGTSPPANARGVVGGPGAST